MPPTRPSSRAALRGRRPVPVALLVASAIGGAVGAAPAAAAWTPLTSLTPGTDPSGMLAAEAILTGALPGQAAFLGTTDDGAAATLVHAPGVAALRAVASPVPGDAEGFYGDGNAVAYVTGGVLHLGTMDGAGAFGAVGTASVDPAIEIGAVAAAGDGTVAAVFLDDGRARLALARPGQSATTVGLSPDAANTTAIAAGVAAMRDGGYTAAWIEEENGSEAVGGVRVGANGTVGQRISLAGPNVPTDATLESIVVPAGLSAPAAVWSASTDGTSGPARGFATLSVEDRTVEVLSYAGETAPDIRAVALPSGRIVVAAVANTEAVEPYPVTTVLAPDGQSACTAASGILDRQTVRVGDAVALVGIGTDGRVVRQDVRDDCSVTAPNVGPELRDGSILAAGVDAEGSLVAAAGDAEGRSSFAVDDRTPPTVGGLKVPARIAAGDRLTASVEARDAWGVGKVSWRLDGRAFDEGTTASGQAPDPGQHRLEVTATDAAGNRAQVSAAFTVVADDPGAPAAAPGKPTPGADVPLPKPKPKPGGKPARPGDPTVRIRSLQETSRGWVLRLRVGDVSRVRLRLYRERYLGAGQVRRRLTCPARPRPLRRPPSGLRGRTTVVVKGSTVTLRIPRPLADALTKRGRYTLSVVGLGTGAKARTASPAANRSFTAC